MKIGNYNVGTQQWSVDNGNFTFTTTVILLFFTLVLSPLSLAIPSTWISLQLKDFIIITINAIAGFLKVLDKMIGIAPQDNAQLNK